MSSAVSAVEVSLNSKIGRVSATYAAQQTCPQSCKLKGSGCYAESGLVGMHTKRLNQSSDARDMSVDELAMHEAIALAGLSGKLPVRLHVMGDATTNTAAKLLSDAAQYHTNKYSQPVWTYTHAWREVERRSWQQVSILASCESTQDAREAMSRGYAAAVVVDHHESDKAYELDGIKLVPCPQQTGRAATCVECGLCMRAPQLLKMGSVIAFEAHGQQAGKAKQALVQIQ